jgi:hypothetical protein
MKPLTITSWIAALVVVLVVVDHFAGRTAVGYVPAGLLVLFVLMELPRAVRSETIAASVLAAIGIGAAVASGDELAPIFLNALRRTESFFLLFAAVAWLRVPAEISPSIRQAQEAAQNQPPGRRFLVLSIATQILGAVLNLAGISLLVGIVREAPTEALRRRFTRALTQGFTSASCWTPFFVAMSVGLSFFPGLRWSDVAPLGITMAIILAVVSWAMDRLLYARDPAETDTRTAEPPRASGFHWRMGVVPVSLFVLVVSAVEEVGWPIPVALAIVAPIYAMVWMGILNSRRAPLTEVTAGLARRVVGGLPGLRGEAMMFLSANLLGVGVAAVLPPEVVVRALDFLVLPPDALIILMLLIILAVAAIGVHPLMPVLIFGQVLPPAVLGISPAVFCAGLVTMWGVGAVVSPFSGTTLFMRRVGNLSAWRVAWLWNGPYGLLTTGILGVLMIVTRHLGLF